MSAIGVVGVGSSLKGTDSVAIQPGLDRSIGAKVVLKALKVARGKLSRGCNPLRGEIGKCRVVRLAIVHKDAVLSTDAKVLICAESRVGHRDERDMGVSKCL